MYISNRILTYYYIPFYYFCVSERKREREKGKKGADGYVMSFIILLF